MIVNEFTALDFHGSYVMMNIREFECYIVCVCKVFGRGGEEMDFLQQQGIHVKVIPGITAASGIAAELGIPLTHRGIANSVRFLTGHSRKGGSDPLFVSENAADPDSTLVVYMGLSTFPSLSQKLMHHGLSPQTPAVAIERGTTLQQRTVRLTSVTKTSSLLNTKRT